MSRKHQAPQDHAGLPENGLASAATATTAPLWANPMLLLLAVTSLVGVAGGFILPSREEMRTHFQNYGFQFITATFLFWGLSYPFGLPSRATIGAAVRRHWLPVVLAVLVVVLSFATCPTRYRILADETNLLGMAAAMYDHHTFHNPTEMIFYFDGVSETISKQWDKRALGYPFMIYLAHCLLGYRPENAFVVNALATLMAMLLFYWLLQRWLSRFLAGVGMVALGSFPLVVLWTTSAGFEMPNLAFAILVFLLLDDFLQHPTAPRAEWLAFSLLLLAQIRYESALFFLALAPVALAFLPPAEWRRFSWRLSAVPLLLLPVAWQRLVMIGTDMFQMEGGKPAFHPMWLKDNLRHAWRFFTGASPNYGMMPVWWWFALAGIPAAVWQVVRYWTAPHEVTSPEADDGEGDDRLRRPASRRERDGREVDPITATTTDGEPTPEPEPPTPGALSPRLRLAVMVGTSALIVFLQAAVLFNYYWGNLTLQYAMRLGIIFIPFQIALALQAIGALTDGGRRRRLAVVVVVAMLIGWHWNVPGQNAAVREIFYYREHRLVSDWLKTLPHAKQSIIVSDLSNLYTPFRYSTINFGTFNANPEGWKARVRRHLFQQLIAVQKINYGTGRPSNGTYLPDTQPLEVLYRTQLNAEEFLRISRIDHEPPPPPPAPPSQGGDAAATAPGVITADGAGPVHIPVTIPAGTAEAGSGAGSSAGAAAGSGSSPDAGSGARPGAAANASTAAASGSGSAPGSGSGPDGAAAAHRLQSDDL